MRYSLILFLLVFSVGTLLAQTPCTINPSFGLSASNTVCANDAGMTPLSFTIYNAGDPGTYKVTFPDGQDTIVSVTSSLALDHLMNFDCENMPGSPDDPNGGAHFFSYINELVVTRTDCVDELGQHSEGYYNFNVVTNPITGIIADDTDCLPFPFAPVVEGDICDEDLVQTYKWFVDGVPVVDSLNKIDLEGYPFFAAGTYTVKLEVTDFFGCGTYAEQEDITITAEPALGINLQYDAAALCSPVITINLNNNSKYVDSYHWSTSSADVSFSDPNIATPVITINNSAPGIYTFEVTGTSAECGDVTQEFSIETFDEQTITLDDALVSCTDAQLDVCDFVSFSPEPNSVTWTVSDPNVSISDINALCPIINSTASGDFVLTVTGKDVCLNDFTKDVPISVTPTQIVNLTIDVIDTMCVTQSPIQLLDANYITPLTYITGCVGSGVDFASGCLFDPVGHVGSNTITFIDECAKEHVMEIIVVEEGGFLGGEPEACYGEVLDLTTLQPAVYSGIGVTSNIFNSSVAGVGIHELTFDASANFCGGIGQFDIKVLEQPVGDFDITNTPCVAGSLIFPKGAELTIKNTSNYTVTCYEVLETGEQKCGENEVTFLFDEGGQYTIQQIVATESCQDTITKTITIEAPITPMISIVVDSSSCDEYTITFSQDTVASEYQYHWVFNEGLATSDDANTSVTLEKPMFDSLLLAGLTIEAYCSDIEFDEIVQLPARMQVSMSVLNDNSTGCSEETIYFQNTSSNFDSLHFFFNNSAIPSPFMDSLSFVNLSDTLLIIPVKMEGFRGNCPSVIAYDTFYVAPVFAQAAFALDYGSRCSPFVLKLKNSSTYGAKDFVIWGDGSSPQVIQSLAEMEHTYVVQSDTTMQIYLVSQLCGIDTVKKSVSIYAAPQDIGYTAFFPNNACSGDSCLFTLTQNGNSTFSVNWIFGDGTTSQVMNPTHVYEEPGVYNVQIEASTNEGCSAAYEAPIEIKEYEGVPLSIEVPNQLCEDQEFNINIINSEPDQWINYGNGLVSAEPVDMPYQEGGDFKFIFYSQDEKGCSHDTTVMIHVLSNFDLQIIPENDTIIDLGALIELDFVTTQSANLDSILWIGESINFPNNKIIQARPLADGYYTVEAFDNFGCKGQDSIYVWIDRTYEDMVYIPNTFSPTGNGLNEIFYIRSKQNSIAEIKMFQIFDRWGNMVFGQAGCLPNDPSCGWNGEFRDGLKRSGVYIYRAQIEFLDGKIKEFFGDVTLIK